MNDNEITTLQVSKTTRDRVASIGKKGETYDDILNALVDMWNKYGGLINKK